MTKVAVIGAGRWGMNIIRTLAKMGALAAIAEQREETVASLRQQYPGIPIYTDAYDLIKSDIKAVAIATLPQTHYPIVKAALQVGKDVFIEKPITLCSKEAEELQQIAEYENRVLMVGHLLLYQPAIQWIKEYIQAGNIGDIYALHQERLNLGTARSAENALWSLAVHDVAVLLHLVGETPVQIVADGYKALQPNIEDDVYVHMKFPSGTQANIHCSWLWPEKRRQLTIIGSKGMLVFDELNQCVSLHKKGISSDLVAWDNDTESVFEEPGTEPLRLELQHFIDCVETRKTPISDGGNGVEVVKVLERISRQLMV
jgi:predicted dehydrogenase